MNDVYEILLVEDNPGDVVLLKTALSAIGLPHRLHVAADGNKGLAFLLRQNEFAQAPRPDLVVLDQNLPRKSGQEVLTAALSDPGLRAIPFLLLSGSACESHVVDELGLPRDAYLVKPHHFSGYLDVARRLADACAHGRLRIVPAS
jgi:CheY-like chemotaxis protein